MKHALLVSLLALTVVAAHAAAAAPVPQATGGKVLLAIRDNRPADAEIRQIMLVREADVMITTLQKAGYIVEIASPTGAPWGTGTDVLKSDKKLRDVKVADYQAVVIPCLGIDSMDLHPDLAAVIKAAVKANKIVAGQNGGVAMLAKAGALDGKKYAAIELASAPELGKGTYTGSGVAVDGNVITSGVCPGMAAGYPGTVDGTSKLMETVITALKQAK